MRSLVMYKRKGLKRKVYKQWHGPARVIGKDLQGCWFIHRGSPILAHPRNLRRAIAEEQELMLEDDDTLPSRPGGQQGFLDLSKPQDPIDLDEENGENAGEYSPTEPPVDDGAAAEKPTQGEEDEMARTYHDECTSSGDESREVREMKRIARHEKRKKEGEAEETTEAADDDQDDIKRLRRPKKPDESSSKKRRKRKKKLEEAKEQQNVEEQSVPQEEPSSMPSSSIMDEERKRKRALPLDDVPESIRGVMRRRLEDKEVDSSGGIEMSVEEKETMCVAFLAERMDTYTKRNKRTELNPQKMKSQLPQFTDKEIEEAMQKAVEKEIGAWQRFDAIDH